MIFLQQPLFTDKASSKRQ